MRTYPRNSPEAAARLVALAMICDGNLCCSEIDTLKRFDVARTLGLPDELFARVVQTLCEDQLLPIGPGRPLESVIAPATITAMLDEVDDPDLQRKVMYLAMATTLADRHLADGEINLMKIMFRRWYPTGPAIRIPPLHVT